MQFHYAIDSWKARGGWATNAFLFEIPKTCSMWRTHFRQYYRVIMKFLFKNPDQNCPIPQVGFTSIRF